MTPELITVEMVLGWQLCYSDQAARALVGDGVTVEQGLALDIPDSDKMWCLLRPEFIEEPTLALLACRWAESVLPAFERLHPDNPRPRRVIEVRRAHLRGEATNRELRTAGRTIRWAVKPIVRSGDRGTGSNCAAEANAEMAEDAAIYAIEAVTQVSRRMAGTTMSTVESVALVASDGAWIADGSAELSAGIAARDAEEDAITTMLADVRDVLSGMAVDDLPVRHLLPEEYYA